VGAALVAAYAALPEHSLAIRLATGLWALCAVGYGISRYRPRHAEAWVLLAVSVAVYQVADASDFGLPSDTRPGAADWIAFAGYPLAAAGLVLMVRSRRVGRDVAGLLDALVAAIALAYPAWVFLVEPFIGNGGLSAAVRLASIVPPVGDLVLIWIIARLLVTGSAWSASIWLLTTGVVVCAAADTCEALWRLDVYPWFGTAVGQGVVAGGWMGYCLLWGAAALVPSMRENTVPVARRGADLMPARIALLVAVVLVVPATVAVQRLRGQAGGWLALASGCAVTVLIMLRIALVLAQHRRALAHEETLLAASETLASASGVDEIAAALRTAVERLFAGAGPHRSMIAVMQDGEDAEKAVETGGDTPPGAAFAAPGHAAKLAAWCAGAAGRVTDSAGLLRTETLPAEVARALDGAGQALAVPIANAADRGGGHRRRNGAIVVAGREYDLLTRAMPLEILAGQAAMSLTRIGLNREISRRDAQRYFQTLVQNESDAILIVGTDRRVRYASPSAEALFAATDLAGREVGELLGPAEAAELGTRLAEGARRGQARRDWRITPRRGGTRETEATVSDLRHDPTVAGLVVSLRDVTEARRKDRALHRLAYQDELTGLPNRAAFQRTLEQALAGLAPGERLRLVMADIDDFRELNDAHGREIGDRALRAAADALPVGAACRDTLARVGPDEFAFLRIRPDRAPSGGFAPPCREAAEEDLVLDVGPARITFSGAVVEAERGASPASLLADAEMTLHAARQAGRPHTWRRFDPALRWELERNAVLRARLARAVAGGEFALVYQPIVSLRDRSLTGFETLIRWPQPDGGVLGPDAFIPLAEATGQILPLGDWILRTAAGQAAAWNRARARDGRDPLRVTVNVSAHQLRAPEFPDTVADALAGARLDPDHLVLEATESALIKGTDLATDNLRATASLGVGLALDDFGTGYSSLSYLQSLPVTGLKIDKSFVWGLADSARQLAILEGIIGIGRSLALTVIAEGIETEAHCRALTRLGADRGQGYLFGRPMPPEQAGALTVARAPARSTEAGL
jgi:diguanylate cyclase (GGDEF)-like protein/PAS domain S-box-containing protein